MALRSGRTCPEEIEANLSTRLAAGETTEQLVGRCERVVGWGVQHLIFVSSTPWAPADLDGLTGVAAAATELRWTEASRRSRRALGTSDEGAMTAPPSHVKESP